MPKLIYKKVNSDFFRNGCGFMLSDITDEGAELRIALSGTVSGTLKIDRVSYPLTAGEATVTASVLPDGAYAPRLICEGRELSLMPFAMKGGMPQRFPIGDAYTEALTELILRAYERCALLDTRVGTLEEKINGAPLLNFYNTEG